MWLNESRDKKAQVTYWSFALQQYQFTIEHCKGPDNVIADGLSRMNVNSKPCCALKKKGGMEMLKTQRSS